MKSIKAKNKYKDTNTHTLVHAKCWEAYACCSDRIHQTLSPPVLLKMTTVKIFIVSCNIKDLIQTLCLIFFWPGNTELKHFALPHSSNTVMNHNFLSAANSMTIKKAAINEMILNSYKIVHMVYRNGLSEYYIVSQIFHQSCRPLSHRIRYIAL